MTFRNAFPHRLFGSCVACFLVLIVLISLSNRNEHLRSDLVKRSVKEDDNKVPVELYVMSKCPDAVFCESVFSNVITEIGEIVDPSLNFIGSLNETAKYGTNCMHGDTECLGNIQELCAQRVSKNWYSFVLCMNKDFRKIGVDDTITDNCLKFSGINKKRFDHCVDRRGKTLLTRNVKRSINLGLNKSCTILINRGEYKCIHDGTWKECSGGYQVDDFVRQICISYEGKNISPRCKKYFK